MKKILLHTCCGPCATACVEKLLSEGWETDLFFSNSNISPYDEYLKRAEYARKTAEHFGTGFIEDEYNHQSWLEKVSGYEDEPEKGLRCSLCFSYSFSRAAQKFNEGGYDAFTTTLTVSPHKISKIIFEQGGKYPGFIGIDFKKKNGFARSLELADELGLYRQSYCGCEFSIR